MTARNIDELATVRVDPQCPKSARKLNVPVRRGRDADRLRLSALYRH